LILGINPGSEGCLLEVDRTSEDFLKGNPYFSKDVKWPLWSRLNSIFEAGGISHLLKDDQLFVWSNMFHCDTKHSQELGKYSLNEEHIALTKELINVLQPKFIVCLGTQDCFAKLISLYQKKSKSLLPGVVDYFLVDEKIPVYGIYHTSCRYTREKKVLLGKVLGALYRGEVVPDSEALRNLFMTEIKAFEEALAQGQRASQLREEYNLSDSEYLSILDGEPLTEVLAKRT
jgi:hypothetical protein